MPLSTRKTLGALVSSALLPPAKGVTRETTWLDSRISTYAVTVRGRKADNGEREPEVQRHAAKPAQIMRWISLGPYLRNR